MNQNEDEIFQHKPAVKILENHHCFIHTSDLCNEVLVVLTQNSEAFQTEKNKVFFNTHSTRKTTESQKNNTKFNVLCLSYSKNNWFSFQQKHIATILKNNTLELPHPKNATRRRHSLPTADRKYVTEFLIHRNLSEKWRGTY